MKKPAPPPPPSKTALSRETLGVLGVHIRKTKEGELNRDFAQAMKAVKPPAKP